LTELNSRLAGICAERRDSWNRRGLGSLAACPPDSISNQLL
jgi:hypothetical protein